MRCDVPRRRAVLQLQPERPMFEASIAIASRPPCDCQRPRDIQYFMRHVVECRVSKLMKARAPEIATRPYWTTRSLRNTQETILPAARDLQIHPATPRLSQRKWRRREGLLRNVAQGAISHKLHDRVTPPPLTRTGRQRRHQRTCCRGRSLSGRRIATALWHTRQPYRGDAANRIRRRRPLR